MSTAPVYDRNPSHLPEIDESDVGTVGVGLYRVTGKTKRGDIYDATIGDVQRDVEQVMLARVDDGPMDLPVGVHRAEIRPDGKRLICAWVIG